MWHHRTVPQEQPAGEKFRGTRILQTLRAVKFDRDFQGVFGTFAGSTGRLIRYAFNSA